MNKAASIHEVFNNLVADKQVKVNTKDSISHDLLRIRLVKLFSRHKATMAAMGFADESERLSMCASFDAVTGLSTFTTTKRRYRGTTSYEIVVEDKEIPNAVV